MTSRGLPWLVRCGWIVYWLLFVAYTLYAARNPGMLGPDERDIPYPWGPALLTCAVLGVQTAALNAMLRSAASTRSWREVAIASCLALLFEVLSGVAAVTDMPGYYYAPELFALTNMIVVPIVGAALVRRPPARQRS